MNRTPVCRFYQAGSCEHAASCIFEHPVKRCNKFTSVRWCPYGVSCHFWHDQSLRAFQSSEKREPCLFFTNGQCKYGNNCSKSHDLDAELNEYMTLEEYRAIKQSTKPPTTTRMFMSDTSMSRFVSRSSGQLPTTNYESNNLLKYNAFTEQSSSHVDRTHFERPSPKYNRIPLTEVTEAKLRMLHQLEADRLLTTYSSDEIQESAECESGRNFCLKFSSTDPDWAYDVRELLLNIHLTPAYPTDTLQVKVLNQDHLPVLLVEHLNSAISSWIRTHHQFLKTSGYAELYLRPFLKWFDRKLEDLFTEGLRKVKTWNVERKMNASNMDAHFNTDVTDQKTPVSLISSPHSASVVDVTTESRNRQLSGETDSDDTNHCSGHMTSSATSDHEVDVLTRCGEWIEPVVSRTESVSTNIYRTTPGQSMVQNINMSGTQTVSLEDFLLIEKTSTYLQRSLAVELHCTRCRCNFSWIFNFHFNDRYNNQMRSIPPHATQCARCHQSLKLICERSIAHPFSNRIGTLFLDGCISHDVISKQSSANLTCSECNFAVKIASMDRSNSRQCYRCHSLVGMQFSKFRLDLLKAPTTTSSATKNQTASALDGLSWNLRRAMNASQLPLIRDGMPLPNKGCCKHYRKSYRWLRFPCCGRLEPCDVCHDQNATDGHEMELANRMLCGFCSKEQPFSQTKPCERCGKNLCGTRTAHWEGGKGCRNKVTMSKKDTKKYASTSKTTPKGKS